MHYVAALLLLLGIAGVVAVQMRGAVGLRRAVLAVGWCLAALGGVWGVLELSWRDPEPLPADMTTLAPQSSESCAKCHQSHYDSWHDTFHRTMTTKPLPKNVKGDFSGAVMSYAGVESKMIREGDRFFVDTVDPAWEEQTRAKGIAFDKAGSMPRRKFSVDMLVGSHWMQQYFHLAKSGRYVRLPVVWHIAEKRWMHINGAFLKPNQPQFFAGASFWNASCIYCHNTRPAGNPIPIPNEPIPGYDSKVGELGIACEQCHGASERHIEAHQNPARRLAFIGSGEADPTIANPARMPTDRSDEVCARCHGAPILRPKNWNRNTLADPFLPGAELDKFWRVCWSEAEMNDHSAKEGISRGNNKNEHIDGRFWGDGTPLTTALEYQGMALSACYQNGKGKMRCISCHSMHDAEPNHQVRAGMRTNEACYACHETYKTKLAEHTHHAAESSGSLCMNCHMPHQVYSLLDTHRSHRISVPRVRDSVNTGKPNACNLCHIDKSLGWTNDALHKWYGTAKEALSDEEKSIASSVLHLARGDGRSRAVIAGAFGWEDARKASGNDWSGPLLTQALKTERYEAVRFLLHRSLKSAHGLAMSDYDFQGSPEKRAAQTSALERMLEKRTPPDPKRYPYLPLTPEGRFAERIEHWMKTRSDPDVSINE